MIVRKLNAIMSGDSFCMLLIEDMLDQVGDCKFLSKIDLPKGFTKFLYRKQTRTRLCFAHYLVNSDLTFSSSQRTGNSPAHDVGGFG